MFLYRVGIEPCRVVTIKWQISKHMIKLLKTNLTQSNKENRNKIRIQRVRFTLIQTKKQVRN